MHQIISYIKFLFKSKNQHGVHSPFVYDLVTKCFYDNTEYGAYSKLIAYRNALLNSKESITMMDFGSGSRKFSSNKRPIQQIAKTSGSTLKRAKLLFRLVNYFNAEHILELGTSVGIGTVALAIANERAHVTSIEGCPEIATIAEQQLQAYQVKNVDLKTGTFSKVVLTLKQPTWDLVFFDGHHDKEATLNYFEQLIASSHTNSIFIFDDIYWSKGMTEAWETIKKHPKVMVTIDTFYWGFVFFRTEQAKEHFAIRL